MTESYVLGLDEIDATMVAVAGGKGANLGELTRIDGVRVPAGFCVTTDAFRRIMAAPGIAGPLARLCRLADGDQADDREAIGAASAALRRAIADTAMADSVIGDTAIEGSATYDAGFEGTAIEGTSIQGSVTDHADFEGTAAEGTGVPGGLAAQITSRVAALGEGTACAVRSSATAEDLPGASFAGQHDTYLNVTGAEEIIRHVVRCWASAFTDRAVAYRLRAGFDHRKVQMAVVVQEMVAARASGVLFTADPVTSNRRVACIEAVPGLGEDLVSGLVNADVYRVAGGEITDRKPQGRPVLADQRIAELAALGRRIEAHFGRPQDIEWCLADDGFRIVQSRPITTLFPVPEADDDDNHVYVSVGHQQMMTDPIRPLGISVWQLTAARPMHTAGGRLFVDIARGLAAPVTRDAIVGGLSASDPLMGDALRTVLARDGFLPVVPEGEDPDGEGPGSARSAFTPADIETDPAIVTGLIERTEESLAALKRDIASRSGAGLIDFIVADIGELRRVLFAPLNLEAIKAGMQAAAWLNEHLADWLGEKNPADTLAQSAPGNVTARMGLALLDVANAIRPHPEVVAFLRDVTGLQGVTGAAFLDRLPALDGGRQARDAIEGFLDSYGMRCTGEIDITRPRWRERPDTLVPLLLGNVGNFGPGAGKERFERGLREARRKERDVLSRLRALEDGESRAERTRAMIDRLRTFTGYREYPKYHMVSRYFVYKRALLAEADRLVTAGALTAAEDIFYLTLAEIRDAAAGGRADAEVIRRRREEFAGYAALTPPRVLTSDGEAVAGSYRRGGVPAGALAGLAVSAGTVEGRARVMRDLAGAGLGADDILVTAYTDPSWTPVFVTVKGLVTEVGGLMTHGAVIAREYGLPAVVGVEHATALIRDGQRIRVHGTDGYVELLS